MRRPDLAGLRLAMTPEEIREARRKLGLSQVEIARRLDVDVVTWNRWERGRQDVRFPEILRLAFVGLEVERRSA